MNNFIMLFLYGSTFSVLIIDLSKSFFICRFNSSLQNWMRFWPMTLLMKLVFGKRNSLLSLLSFLSCYPQLSRSNWCSREIHTEMSRYICCIMLKVPCYGIGWLCMLNFLHLQVAKIETEKMLIQMVETELEVRKQAAAYKGQFNGQSHFFGYLLHCLCLCQLIRLLHEKSEPMIITSHLDSNNSDMKEDVVCHLILIPHTAMLWVMVLVYCFTVGKLDWYPRFVFFTCTYIDECIKVIHLGISFDCARWC